MEPRRKRPRLLETETTSSETTNTNRTNAVNPQNVAAAAAPAAAPTAPSTRSWVDDPDPSWYYTRFLTDLPVSRHLEFLPFPRFIAPSDKELKETIKSAKELEKTVKNFEELEQTMKNFLENGEILSFAPILEQESKEKTILVKLKPPSKRPEYSDACPLLELKVTQLLLGLPIPPTIMFRFQVPSCGYSPILGTMLLFPDAKKAYDELVEEKKSRGEPKPPIPISGRYALYRMVLPTGLQAEPFADGESVPSFLAPDTAETPAPWRAMNLPRLRGKRLKIAIAFRENLATMQRDGYFSKLNFKELLQYFDQCMNLWGEELNLQFAAKTPAPEVPAHTRATPVPEAPAPEAPAPEAPAPEAPAPEAPAPEVPARTRAVSEAAAAAPLAPAQPAGTPGLQRFFVSQSPNSSQSTLSPTAPGQRSASPSSR